MSFKPYYSVPQRFRHVLLSIVSGILLALALPKPGWAVCSWIGLVPLLIALRDRRPLRAGLLGVLAGFVYFTIILRWMFLFGTLPWLILAIVEAIFLGVFAALYTRLTPKRIGRLGFIAVPSAWVGVQFLRTLSAYSFTWGSFAHTQANCLPIAQIASVTGPWGIDFVVCFVNVAVAVAIVRSRGRWKPIAAAAMLALAVLAFGWTSLRVPLPSSGSRRIAIVQGSVSDSSASRLDLAQRCFLTYSDLSLRSLRAKPDLILWPETAIPDDITVPGCQLFLGQIARSGNADLLAGGYEPPADRAQGGCYNSLMLFDRSGKRRGTYRKVHLVPFGEFVPLRNQLPFLKDYGIRPEDVLAGRSHPLLRTQIGDVGSSICFESTFPGIARSEVWRGAEMLCIVTNDQSLKRTQGPAQHLMMARLRAIENRRFVLRAAGTGISAVIDPYGRIRHSLGLYRTGTIVDRVVPSTVISPYTRFGDWLAYACIALTLICAMLPVPRYSRKA